MKILVFLLPLMASVLVSCTASTPETRIQKNGSAYLSLSPKHQRLVKQGKIETGMPRQAVWIAWGNPASKGDGQRNGKTFERWIYNGYRPVYTQSFYGGSGYGRYGHRGYYGRRHYGYNSFGLGLGVNYVPYPAAKVDFQNGRVTEWTRGNTPRR